MSAASAPASRARAFVDRVLRRHVVVGRVICASVKPRLVLLGGGWVCGEFMHHLPDGYVAFKEGAQFDLCPKRAFEKWRAWVKWSSK